MGRISSNHVPELRQNPEGPSRKKMGHKVRLSRLQNRFPRHSAAGFSNPAPTPRQPRRPGVARPLFRISNLLSTLRWQMKRSERATPPSPIRARSPNDRQSLSPACHANHHRRRRRHHLSAFWHLLHYGNRHSHRYWAALAASESRPFLFTPFFAGFLYWLGNHALEKAAGPPYGSSRSFRP